MSNLQTIREKINSTTNTEKITKAMEMVSTVKSKRLKLLINDGKDYLEGLKESINFALGSYVEKDIPLLNKNNSSKALIVFVGINRGLVGNLQSKLELEFINTFESLKKENQVDVITLKKRTIDLVLKYGIKPQNHFSNSFEGNAISEITSVKSLILNSFLSGEYSKVILISSRFINSLNFETYSEVILPFEFKHEKSTQTFELEPSGLEVLNTLLENYFEALVIFTLLGASLCEYSARVEAMRKANDNAKEIKQRFKTLFFKSRQSLITRQIQESTKFNKLI